MNSITLTINKRELDFTFGLGFLGELLEQTDLSIDEVVLKLEKNPFKMLPTLMYESAKYALDRKGKEVDFTQHDFIDWIEADGGVMSKNSLKFYEGFVKGMTKDVPEDEEAKNMEVVDAEVVEAPKKK